MNILLQDDQGSILGIAAIYFLIFSLMGMGMLALATYSRLDILDGVHANRNKYAVESALNLALWRMNSGPDYLANFEDNGVASQYDDSTHILTITTDKWGQSYHVSAEMKLDHPFNHGLAYLEEPDTSEYSISALPGHGPQEFDFLPTIDTAYYRQNAVQIYTTGTTSFDDTLPSGIHYVERGTVFLKNGAYLEGSLVVMGKLKVVGNEVTLRAIADSAGFYIPALIVADSSGDISSNPGIVIKGAVFSTSDFDIKGGDLTGPLVVASVQLRKNLSIDDRANEKYYQWPPGFGDCDSYDWPKYVKAGTWRN